MNLKRALKADGNGAGALFRLIAIYQRIKKVA
jgi:hypothetical protein